jgi:hypothetical protein
VLPNPACSRQAREVRAPINAALRWRINERWIVHERASRLQLMRRSLGAHPTITAKQETRVSAFIDMLGAVLEEGLIAFTLARPTGEVSERNHRAFLRLRRLLIRLTAVGIVVAAVSWIVAALADGPLLAGKAAKIGYVALAVGLLALLGWPVTFGTRRSWHGGRDSTSGGA